MAERTVPAQDAEPAPSGGDRAEALRRPDPSTVTTAAEFAVALARLREQAGVGIRDLARQVGSTTSTLSDWFSGRQLPGVSATTSVETIVAACGVPEGAPRQAWLDALARVRRMPGPRLAGVPEPYRGLESYGVEHAAVFFGREKLVARLFALLVTANGTTGPTVVVGPSGCGKTSALHAGLAARLRSAGNWHVVTITPGAEPLAALDAGIDRIRGLALPAGARVALVVDQCEELFTFGADPAVADRFLRRITRPILPGPGVGPTVVVVVALRADFYGAALRHSALGAALQDRQVVVGPMAPEDLRRAVTEPARRAGVQLEPGLVELVEHDLATGLPSAPAPGAGPATAPDAAAALAPAPASVPDGDAAYDASALPLMSFALLETWRRSRQSRMTVEDYVATGGVRGAVAAAAEAVHEGLTPAQRDLARRLFVRLVSVGLTAPDTRRRATAAELGLDTPAGDASSEVLERFVAARLVTTTDTTAEIAHECLITAWPRLRGWVDAERLLLPVRRRIVTDARDWQRDGRDAARLHRGADLTATRVWAADPYHLADLTPTERDFVEASVAASHGIRGAGRSGRSGRRGGGDPAGRRSPRLRRAVSGLTAAALVTGAVYGAAEWRLSSVTGRADDALSRQLAETSNRLRQTDPGVAAQFAVLARRTADTPEARSALLDAAAQPLARRLTGPGGSTVLAGSGDGRVLVAAGDTGAVRVWTLPTGGDPVPTEVTVQTVDRRPLHATAIDHDGRLAVSAGASGVLHLIDLTDAAHPQRLPDVPAATAGVGSLALSPDGRTLAVGVADGRVLLFDVMGSGSLTRLSPLATLGGPGGSGRPLPGPGRPLSVQALTFSADGRALAAGGGGGRIRIWTLGDRSRPQAVPVQLSTGGEAVTSLSYSTDGARLAAGSRDQRVYVWRMATPGQPAQRIEGAANWVNGVAFSPDGTLVAAGSADHHARLYDATTRAVVADLPHPGAVTATTFLPGGRTLVTAAADGVIRLWPLPSPVAAMPVARTFGLAYLGDDRLAAMSSANALRVFDVSQPWAPVGLGSAVGAPSTPSTPSSPSSPSSPSTPSTPSTSSAPGGGRAPGLSGTMAVSRDGSVIAAGGGDGWAWLFAPAQRGSGSTRAVATLPHTQSSLVESAALSPDGRTLVTGSDDATLQFTDVSRPTAPTSIREPVQHPGVPLTLAWSPKGDLLAAGTGTTNAVVLWDVRDPAHPRRIGEPVTGPSLQVYSVAFAPDGRTLAVGSADRSVRLLDVSEPRAARWIGSPLLDAGDYVNGVAFSPDGRAVAAATGNGQVLVWDVADTGAPRLRELLGAAGGQALYAVAFDPGGRRLAAAGASTSVTQWVLDPDEAGRHVCSIAGSPIDRQEWHRYLPSVDWTQPCAP